MKSRREVILTVLCFMFVICFSPTAYAYIPCQCHNPPDKCTCFIQLGDKGLAVEMIISELEQAGYLNSSKKSEFTQEVKQAVIRFQSDHNLECTGWMDDDTLDALLFNKLPDESEVHTAEYWDAICFVPTDGGKRYHADPTCSNMYNPRMISRVNAKRLHIQDCRKTSCQKTIPLTYSALNLMPRVLPDEYYAQEEADSDVNDTQARTFSEDNPIGFYIGNKKTHVFHRNTCNYAKSMSENNRIEFTSHDEATDNGYTPCSKCNP